MGSWLNLHANDSLERISFWDQLGVTLCGVILGFILLISAPILLAWNEFNYVWNRQGLMDVDDMLIEVGCIPDSSNIGKLVLMSCPITQLFNFSQDARLNDFKEFLDASDLNSAWIKIESEIYAWHEERRCRNKNDGHGGRTQGCSYSYHKRWSSEVPVSAGFRCVLTNSCEDKSTGEPIVNDVHIPSILQQEIYAPDNKVSIGQSFGLNAEMVSQLTSAQPLKLNMEDLAKVPYAGAVPGVKWVISQGTGVLRFAKDGDHDTIGDIESTFTKFQLPEEVSKLSAIGQQSSASNLVAWHEDHLGTMHIVNWIEEGVLSKEGFLELKAKENQHNTWLVRLAGWLLVWFALQLITWPLALAPEVIPWLGQLIGEVVGCVLCIVNLAVSLSVALLAAGIAWMIARPWIGVALVIAGLLLTVAACLLACLIRKKNRARKFGSVELDAEAMQLARFRPSTVQSEPSSRYEAQPASQFEAKPSSRFQSEPSSRFEAQPSSRYQAQPSSRFQAQPSSRPGFLAQLTSRPY